MPPVLIAAGVTAAASVGGALLSNSSSKKAANQASQTAEKNTAANNALALNIYGQNRELLNPYNVRGNLAGEQINALLGLGGGMAPQQPAQAPQQAMGYAGVPQGGGGMNALLGRFGGPQMLQEDMWQGDSMVGNAPVGNMQYGQPQALPGTVNTAVPQAAPNAPGNSAFQNFLNSSGFQFQMDQGTKAANQGYAARGMLQSGAALKGLQNYGQQTALNNYFLPYMNLLGQQQGVGLSGASAVAGVGQNYAGQVINSNNLNSQVQLDTIAARNAANQQMYGGIGGALGNLAGTFLGSSYRPF